MRGNEGIDIMDTIVGAMHSSIGRVLIWAGLAAVGLVMAGAGYLFHDWLLSLRHGGGHPLRALDQLGDFPLLLAIPLAWVLILMGCLMHGIGIIYLPFITIGTFLFLSDEEWEERLIFLHLVIGPWPALAIMLDGFPWGALLIWLPWSITWGVIGWMRSRSGQEADDYPVRLTE